MDNFNWVSRINSKPPVTQESLALRGGRPPVGHHLLSSAPAIPQDILPDLHPRLADERAAPTPGSVLEPGLAVRPRAWMMSTSS